MVANYRCNEIREEAEKLVQGKIQSLFHESAEKEIPNFREKVLSIISEAESHYTGVARQYNPEVSRKIQTELTDALKQQLYMSFDNQVKVIKGSTLDNFKKEV